MKLSETTKEALTDGLCMLAMWIMFIVLLSGGFAAMCDRMQKANQEKVTYSQPLP